MQGSRIQRLQGQFREEIAAICQREIKDPRMGFVTITGVELSKDLSHAKVYFSCLGSDTERQHSEQALERSAGYIHELLRKRLRLKMIPRLRFLYDHSIDHPIAMSETLERLKPPPDPNPSGDAG